MAKKSTTRFNPPPNWQVKKNFAPPPGWQPDPSWGPAPQGWPVYVTETKKTHRFRNFLGLLVLLVVVIVIATQLSGGSGDNTAGSDANAPAAVTDKIGSTVKAGDFAFVVTSFKCGVKSVGESVVAEKAQGQFCLAALSVTNNGKDAGTLSDDAQVLFDKQGRKFSASTAADISIPDNRVLLEQINPGNTAKGTIAFDVPTSGFSADHIELKSGFGFTDTPAKVSLQ